MKKSFSLLLLVFGIGVCFLILFWFGFVLFGGGVVDAVGMFICCFLGGGGDWLVGFCLFVVFVFV